MAENRFIRNVKRIPRSYYLFGIFCLLFVALMIFVEIKNGKFWTNDFKVYYDATRDFFNGNSPYKKAYGLETGYFKYTPTTLYYFLFVSKFSYFTAQIIHSIVLLSSLIVGITTLHKLLFYKTIQNKKSRGLLYLAFAFIAVHLVREFHIGNINLILFVLFILGLKAFLNNKSLQIAIFWSILVILKPIVIMAFIPLIIFQQWKVILYMLGFGIVFLLIPILHKGFSEGVQLWNDWLNAIAQHGDYIVSENSFKYLANYYFGFKSNWIPSLIGLVLLMVIMLIIHSKHTFNLLNFIEWSALFLAFTPNFFVTDTEHFLLSLPFILVLFKRLLLLRNKLFWSLFVLFIVPFSLKSNDLLGKTLSSLANETGLIGLANFALILLFCYIAFSEKSEKVEINYSF